MTPHRKTGNFNSMPVGIRTAKDDTLVRPVHCLLIAVLLLLPATARPDVLEASGTGNVEGLAGHWRPVESSRHLLDSKLASRGQAGFRISIDKKLGDSHRKATDAYYEQYAAFLKKNGHVAVASGYIRFDHGGESEIVISSKGGSQYLWYGVVTGGNPRIFLGRGSNESSVATLAVEWAAWCSDSPIDVDRDYATVIYRRVDRTGVPPRRPK